MPVQMKVLVVSNVDQFSDLEEMGKGLFMCLAKWSFGFAAEKWQIALNEVVSDRWINCMALVHVWCYVKC